mgnify:CR=1 FL=1
MVQWQDSFSDTKRELNSATTHRSNGLNNKSKISPDARKIESVADYLESSSEDQPVLGGK